MSNFLFVGVSNGFYMNSRNVIKAGFHRLRLIYINHFEVIRLVQIRMKTNDYRLMTKNSLCIIVYTV